MSHLTDITQRHGSDRVRDLCFVGTALLITALSIGALTSQAVGKAIPHHWSVMVVDPATHHEVR
jgi:hypothetical protein